ncbi:MAG: Bax inhibitor-1/YccA family membrane protein [Cytophagales bacterium]
MIRTYPIAMRQNPEQNFFGKKFKHLQEEHLIKSTMTMKGTINKVCGALMVAFLGAFATIKIAPEHWGNVFYGGLAISLATGLGCTFKPHMTCYLIWPYAFCKGITLGLISFMLDSQLPGVATEALFATFTTLGVIFIGQRSGLLRTTPRSRKIAMYAFSSFCWLQISCFVAHHFFGYMGSFYRILFGIEGKGTEGLISIIASLFVIVLLCFLLVGDLEMIRTGINQYKISKNAEWYCAFILLVSIFRVYFEILKLMAKSSRRRR